MAAIDVRTHTTTIRRHITGILMSARVYYVACSFSS